jgi:hypothetical protein
MLKFHPPNAHSGRNDALLQRTIACRSDDGGAGHVSGGQCRRFAICSIADRPTGIDHQNITSQGTAVGVKETTSHRGNDYTTFKLQDPSGCGGVNVFAWGHPALNNGDQVRVEGVFETVHHQGRHTLYNEVEASKVTSLPR